MSGCALHQTRRRAQERNDDETSSSCSPPSALVTTTAHSSSCHSNQGTVAPSHAHLSLGMGDVAFYRAVAFIASSSVPSSSSTKLHLYALYKVATVAPIPSVPRPSLSVSSVPHEPVQGS